MKPVNEIIDALPEERRARVAARAEQLIGQEMAKVPTQAAMLCPTCLLPARLEGTLFLCDRCERAVGMVMP